jgi:hypothetical protein
MFADVYRAMAERGFGPEQVDRWDWYQLRSVLGQHRHPDYWKAWTDALREKSEAEFEERQLQLEAERGPSRRGGRGVPSRGARSALPGNRLARSKSLFDARRAAARGERPEPEAAAPKGAGVGMVAGFLRGG